MTLDNIAQVAIPNGTRHRGPFAPTSCAFVTDSETSSSCLSRTTNGCVVPTTTDALFRGDVCSWHPMEEKRQSSCGAVRCHTLHTAHLGYWFPEGSHVPRSEEDSCNLLHDKHPQSDSPTTMKARLRTYAGQAPSDSSQVHYEQCVRSKLARPMVEPIRHSVQATVGYTEGQGLVVSQ